MDFCKRSYQPISRYLYTETIKCRGEISLHEQFDGNQLILNQPGFLSKFVAIFCETYLWFFIAPVMNLKMSIWNWFWIRKLILKKLTEV